ncbi:MAG: cupin domain-containing protein [Fuerstiella sp.]|nr:cupin domain-containing protein [Fuerstiella sp.]
MNDSSPGSHYIDVENLDWQSTRFPGVDMKILWSDPDGEAFTALFRTAPGTTLPKHQHRGIEQTFILEGSLVDEDGVCTAGNFVWRDVGSVHAAHTPEGSLAISIFQKTNHFFDEEPQSADE